MASGLCDDICRQAETEANKNTPAALPGCFLQRIGWPDIPGGGVRRRPHSDARDDTHGGKHGDNRAAAVGDEGERQADDRKNAHAHTYIDHDLEDQHAGDTDADQPVHVAAGFDADHDAADYNGCQQKQDKETANHTQLLADGGEDEIRVLRIEPAGLGLSAVVKALTCHAASLKRNQAVLGMPAHIQPFRVNGRIENHQNTLLLVVADEPGPDQGCCRGDGSEGRQKPAQVDTAHVGHDDEDKHIGERHACIIRRHQNQPHHNGQQGGHLQYRKRRRDSVSIDAHGLGQNNDEGNLTELSRLNAERKPAERQPASIAGGTLDTPDEQGGDKQNIKDQKDLSPLGDDVDVDQGKNDIEDDSDEKRCGLNQDEPPCAHPSSGAGDDHDAKGCGNDAESQQQHIRFPQKFAQGSYYFTQGNPPSKFFCYFSILRPGSKHKIHPQHGSSGKNKYKINLKIDFYNIKEYIEYCERSENMALEMLPEWMTNLDDEDAAFIKKFVLASGSLKEMARQYDVTYPTVRLRLDKLIQKIQLSEDTAGDPYIALVKRMAINDKIDFDTAKVLIAAYKKTKREVE